MGRYFAARGWAHVLLLAGVGIFLFPFVWMLATSLKTDDELISPNWWPAVPTFVGESPYVRPAPVIAKPVDVPGERWDAVFPRLRELARAAIDAVPTSAIGSGVDATAWRDAGADRLVADVIGKLSRKHWDDADGELLRAYAALLTPDAARAALDGQLARLELRGVQMRSNDARLFNLCRGDEVAQRWTIESGDADFVPGETGTTLRYRFNSGEPIVLRFDFDSPVAPDMLHKLSVAMKNDDSYHRIDATLEIDSQRWRSGRTTYVAQHRAASIFFQPVGFDDTTFKPKTWVTLKPYPKSVDIKPGRASLSLTLSPSSTPRAIYGKVQRNYARAFHQVPFWTYIGNSLLLVTLVTVGTLFSSAFVAYGFARLRWPGRSVAFVLLLATMMLPAQVTMIPSFMIWRALGWYNTLNPLWVPAWFGGAFFIFLMVQHMKTIPLELEEAARLDGLNAVQTWYYIILPQVKPTMAAIAIMTFMAAWNEFMGPLIYLRDQSKFPLSLGLFGIRIEAANDWTMIMAGNVLMTIPVIVIFFLFQRYFIEGMTMSGMKG
jgi:multiple sugar transport system permease protein